MKPEGLYRYLLHDCQKSHEVCRPSIYRQLVYYEDKWKSLIENDMFPDDDTLQSYSDMTDYWLRKDKLEKTGAAITKYLNDMIKYIKDYLNLFNIAIDPDVNSVSIAMLALRILDTYEPEPEPKPVPKYEKDKDIDSFELEPVTTRFDEDIKVLETIPENPEYEEDKDIDLLKQIFKKNAFSEVSFEDSSDQILCKEIRGIKTIKQEKISSFLEQYPKTWTSFAADDPHQPITKLKEDENLERIFTFRLNHMFEICGYMK